MPRTCAGILAGFTLFVSLAAAATEPSACLTLAFRVAFVEKGLEACYAPGNCGSNALNLLRLLREKVPGFDLRDAKVLYVLPPEGTLVTAVHTRSAFSLWKYHAVVEYRGMVFDLDYHDTPQIVPMPEYLNEMYFLGEGEYRRLLQRLHISASPEALQLREIPAVDYEGNWTTGNRAHRTEKFYSSAAAEKEYPSRPLVLDRSPPSELPEFPPLGPMTGTWKYDITYVEWRNDGLVYRFDLSKTKITIYGRGGEIYDADKALLFIRRLEQEMDLDPMLLLTIDQTHRQR